MIKQRPRRYPRLLLTCDLRCATFTLKYNADWFGLFLDWGENETYTKIYLFIHEVVFNLKLL